MANSANITRRTLVKAFPFIGAVVAVPVFASEVRQIGPLASDSPMARAIEAHRKAYEEFNDSCPFADEMDNRYNPAGAALNKIHDKAEQRMLKALLQTKPFEMTDNRARATHLVSLVKRGCELSRSEVRALLVSMT